MSTTRQPVTRLTLDMRIPDSQRSVTVTEGDVNRRWEITLIDGGRPFPVPLTWKVALAGVKSDGTELYNWCVIDNHGRVIYDFADGPQIATCVGAFPVRLDLWDEAGRLVASPSVWVNVMPGQRARISQGLASTSEFTFLAELINDDSELKKAMETMEGRIMAASENTDELEGRISNMGETADAIEEKQDGIIDGTITVAHAAEADSACFVGGREGTDDCDRHVWFSRPHHESDGKSEQARAYDDGFLYNPATKTLTAPSFKGTLYGTATSAGMATRAYNDGNNNPIHTTYAAFKENWEGVSLTKAYEHGMYQIRMLFEGGAGEFWEYVLVPFTDTKTVTPFLVGNASNWRIITRPGGTFYAINKDGNEANYDSTIGQSMIPWTWIQIRRVG